MNQSPKYVGFSEAVKLFFSNYFYFSGRSTRSEYWWFVVFNIIVAIFLSILAAITKSQLVSILYGLYGLAILIPSITLSARRLHDIGKGFGWIFISLIPLIGWIILIVYTATESGPANQWGYPAGQNFQGAGGFQGGFQQNQNGWQMPQQSMGGMQNPNQFQNMGGSPQMGQPYGMQGQQQQQNPFAALGAVPQPSNAPVQNQNQFQNMGGSPQMGQQPNSAGQPFAAQGQQPQNMNNITQKICPNCRAPAQPGDRFCQNCGTQIL